MSTLKLIKANSVLNLGQKLGTGGEGTVYHIQGDNSKVAKLYHQPIDNNKENKLKAMLDFSADSLIKIAAWPQDLIIDNKGSVKGLIMPLIQSYTGIHELYSIKSRSRTYPEIDFRFILHASINLARAFANMHELDQVIGDVNHANILVNNNGLIKFIDCDSFQFKSKNEVFTCNVGSSLFLPPELHGVNLRGLNRTQNHDCFSLAILLFHLLYMGRHPFSGRYKGQGDMTIEDAIKNSHFAYLNNNTHSLIEQPPNTLNLDSMGLEISSLFTDAFSPNKINSGRPLSPKWIEILTDLKQNLIACPNIKAHYFHKSQAICPWCLIENKTGMRLFGVKLKDINLKNINDINILWQAILAIQPPVLELYNIDSLIFNRPADLILPKNNNFKQKICFSILLFISVILVFINLELSILTFILAIFFWPRIPVAQLKAYRLEVNKTQHNLDRCLAKLNDKQYINEFNDRLDILTKARLEIIDMPNEYKRKLDDFEINKAKYQLELYLDSFKISDANIKGIGNYRVTTLASYGIETALDIDYHKIINLPGFGPTIANVLNDWALSLKQKFIYQPHKPVDPILINNLKQELDARYNFLLNQLRQGPSILRSIKEKINYRKQPLLIECNKAWHEFNIAKIKLKALES